MTWELAYALAFWTLLVFVAGIKFDHYLALFFSQFFGEDEDVELIDEEEGEDE